MSGTEMVCFIVCASALSAGLDLCTDGRRWPSIRRRGQRCQFHFRCTEGPRDFSEQWPFRGREFATGEPGHSSLAGNAAGEAPIAATQTYCPVEFWPLPEILPGPASLHL